MQELDKLIDLLKPHKVEYEIFHQEIEEEIIEFKTDNLKQIKTNFHQAIAVRVIKDNNIGFSATTTFNNIPQLIDDALLSIKFGNKANFSFEKDDKEINISIFDEDVVNLKTNEIIDKTKEMVEVIHSYNKAIHCDVDTRKIISKIRIINSAGLNKKYKKTILHFSIGAILTKEKGLVNVFEVEALCKKKINYESISKKIIEKIQLAENEVDIKSGLLPCIFSPKAIYTSLLATLKVGINGKFVQKGASPLCNRINTKIFSDKLTIYDDSTCAYYINSYPIDDEGIPSKKKVIFENGILKNFVLDKQTAVALKMETTSNGRRPNALTQVEPTTSNLVIERGDRKLEEMLKNIRYGIFVDQLIGFSPNPISGEFSGSIELGYKIENGEITGRIKDTVLSGNIYTDLMNIELTAERELFAGSLLTPYICFEKLNIESKS